MQGAYRSDKEAVGERIVELEARIAELDAKLVAIADLQRERVALTQELAERRARLNAPNDDRRATSLLQNVRVARPCKASWDVMVGNDQVRHCQTCDRDVFNLSAMTAAEAEALIVQKNGKMCTRFFQRPDGTVMTSDCPVAQQAMRRRVAMVAAGGAMLATVTLPLASATVTMGEMQMPEHPRPVVDGSGNAVRMGDMAMAPQRVEAAHARVVEGASDEMDGESHTERNPELEERAPETLRSPTEAERLGRR